MKGAIILVDIDVLNHIDGTDEGRSTLETWRRGHRLAKGAVQAARQAQDLEAWSIEARLGGGAEDPVITFTLKRVSRSRAHNVVFKLESKSA